ncbi:hypothetical protein [Gordonia sp. DT101]
MTDRIPRYGDRWPDTTDTDDLVDRVFNEEPTVQHWTPDEDPQAKRLYP